MSQVIASRTLKIRRATGDIDVPIRVFMLEPDAGSWKCQFEIGWPDQPKLAWSGGIDPMQALYLTLVHIGVDLYTSPYHEAGELMWDEPGEGYGFPVVASMRHLLVGMDRKF